MLIRNIDFLIYNSNLISSRNQKLATLTKENDMTVGFLRRLAMAVFPGNEGFDKGFCVEVAFSMEKTGHLTIAMALLDPGVVSSFSDAINLLFNGGGRGRSGCGFGGGG